MNIENKVRGLFLLAIVLVIGWFIFAADLVYADTRTPDIRNDVETNVGVDNNANATTGDLVIEGFTSNSRSLALANSMGDVDINDCRESTQWGTPLFSIQGVRLNPWCAAEVYDAKGMPEMAAKVRCLIPEIKKMFSTTEECWQANTVQTLSTESAVALAALVTREHHDEDEEIRERMIEQQAIIGSQQQQLESVSDRLARLEKRKVTVRPVTNQVGLTEDQRKAIEQVFKK